MWTGFRKAGQHALGVMFGAVLATVVIFEGADRVWPGTFDDREAADLRRVLREDLAKLKERVAAHEFLLSQTSRARGEAPVRVPPPDGSYHVDPPEGPYEEIPPGKLYKLGVAIDNANPGGGSTR